MLPKMLRDSTFKSIREENILLPCPEYVPYLAKARVRLLTGLPAQISISTGLLCMLLVSVHAWGSSGVVAAIEKKYVVTEVSANHDQITKDGTTMALKCAGVYSLPTSGIVTTPPDNAVSDGKIKSPNMMVKYTLESLGAHVLQTGDKVYITKIEDKVDSKGDLLKFSILTVESLDVKGGSAQKKFSATVSFHFNKGYLNETPPEDVEQAIEAVMAPDAGTDQAQNGSEPAAQPRQASPPRQAAGVAPPPPPPPPAPAGPPPTISIGESSTQVLQAMGMPQQMIDLGKKKTYVYKNMKVIFVDDKVSDVQ
jgi:hypothetical protein